MNKRIACAFLLAPLLPCLVHAVAMRNPLAFIFYAVFSYPLVAVLGIPSFLLFKRWGWLSWLQVVAAGLLLGLVSGVLLAAVMGWQPEGFAAWSVAMGLAIFAAHGAITAGAFWFIGLRGRNSFPADKHLRVDTHADIDNDNEKNR